MAKCKKCGVEIEDRYQFCYRHNPNLSPFVKQKIEDNNKVRKEEINGE